MFHTPAHKNNDSLAAQFKPGERQVSELTPDPKPFGQNLAREASERRIERILAGHSNDWETWKHGDKFRVVDVSEGDPFRIGDIVTKVGDEPSVCPYFTKRGMPRGINRWAMSYVEVEKIS